MTRHLVELGVSIQVYRNQWGQVIVDLKCPEDHPEVRLNNVVLPEPDKNAPTLKERQTFSRDVCGND